MARKVAEKRSQSPAPQQEDQQQQEQPQQSPNKQQAERGLRRRRQQKPAAPAGKAAAAGDAQEELSDSGDALSWWQYYPWQYGGLTLGAVACCNTVAFYDVEDPFRVHKLMACLALAFVALLIHESRPFKRMNYGDEARERGVTLHGTYDDM